MAKRRHNKGQYPKNLQELVKQKQQLEYLELQMIEKALSSNNPQSFIEAKTYIKGLEEKKNDNLRSFTFSPEQTYYSGQGYKHKPQGLNNELLRNMANTPQIKAIINTRIEQASNFNSPTVDLQKPGWTISKRQGLFDDKEKELTDKEKREIEQIIMFLESGGSNSKWDFEGWETFTRKLYEDSWAIDQGVFEVAVDRIAKPTNFEVYDGATFYLAEHNIRDDKDRQNLEAYMINGYLPKYVQVFANRVYREYYPWELCLGVRNASTSIRLNGYGLSENEVLIQVITWMLNSNQYNGNFFQQGSNPKGILNFKDNVDPTQLENFKQAWGNTLSGVRNSHKLAAISGGNLEWLNMQLCLHGDSEIVIKNGLTTLYDILGDKDEVEEFIWNGFEFKKGRIFKTEKKQVCSLSLRNRLGIKTSPNHKFLTLRDNIPTWVERKDIELGDFVFINKSSVVNKSLKQITYKGKVVEEDLFEFLGWITGDGYISVNKNSKRYVRTFYHPEKELGILDSHLDICKKYDINAKKYIRVFSKEKLKEDNKKNIIKKVIGSYPYIHIGDANFFNWMLENGFKESRKGKRIPKFMYSYLSSCKFAFLRGFFSADGHVSKNGERIDITITSKELKKDTINLLITEGIRCTSFKSKKTKCSVSKSLDVTLIIKDKVEFFDKIGFIQDYKKDREKKRQKSVYTEQEAPIEFIRDLALKIKAYNKTLGQENKLSKKDLHDLLNISKGHQKASLSKVIYYGNLISYKIPDFLKDYRMEIVAELSTINEQIPMFDIEMYDDLHQFYANGMIVHNSNYHVRCSGLTHQRLVLTLKVAKVCLARMDKKND